MNDELDLPEDDGLVAMVIDGEEELVSPEVLRVAAYARIHELAGDNDAVSTRSSIRRYRRCYPGPPDATTPTFREFLLLTGLKRSK